MCQYKEQRDNGLFILVPTRFICFFKYLLTSMSLDLISCLKTDKLSFYKYRVHNGNSE